MSEPNHDALDRDKAYNRGHQVTDNASSATRRQIAHAGAVVPAKAILITFPPSLDCEINPDDTVAVSLGAKKANASGKRQGLFRQLMLALKPRFYRKYNLD
jgi:hypothetical protein